MIFASSSHNSVFARSGACHFLSNVKYARKRLNWDRWCAIALSLCCLRRRLFGSFLSNYWRVRDRLGCITGVLRKRVQDLSWIHSNCDPLLPGVGLRPLRNPQHNHTITIVLLHSLYYIAAIRIDQTRGHRSVVALYDHESLNFLPPGDVCYGHNSGMPRQLNNRKQATLTIPWKMYHATMNVVRAIDVGGAPNVEYDCVDSQWFQITTKQFFA